MKYIITFYHENDNNDNNNRSSDCLLDSYFLKFVSQGGGQGQGLAFMDVQGLAIQRLKATKPTSPSRFS